MILLQQSQSYDKSTHTMSTIYEIWHLMTKNIIYCTCICVCVRVDVTRRWHHRPGGTSLQDWNVHHIYSCEHFLARFLVKFPDFCVSPCVHAEHLLKVTINLRAHDVAIITAVGCQFPKSPSLCAVSSASSREGPAVRCLFSHTNRENSGNCRE